MIMKEYEKPCILLVEDDPNFGSVLSDYLSMNGFDVDHAVNGSIGWTKFSNRQFGIVILDVMMPEKDGFTLAEDIRRSGSDIPIIFLTARAMKDDVITGYRKGADDYVIKPFDSEILLLKIRALLERAGGSAGQKLEKTTYMIGKFSFDRQARELIIEDNSRRLSPRESDLLHLLYMNRDSVLSREKALLRIWGDDNYFNARSMDVFITRLRKYLKPDSGISIINIHGKGYKLVLNN
jgi:DNA-binding response OmpR family regulator